jgi:hypothetical protein
VFRRWGPEKSTVKRRRSGLHKEKAGSEKEARLSP